MRWDARGTIALVASALVGLTAGVVVGITTSPPGDAGAQAPEPSGSTTPASPSDPLQLGAPLQNLDCDPGKSILVVGWGEDGRLGDLVNAVSANPLGEVKYLESADSCRASYGDPDEPTPEYVAYMGPYDTTVDPCALQLSVDHPTDVVTQLDADVGSPVQCLCVLELTDENFPTLALGMRATTREGVFITALQRLLVDIGMNPNRHVNGHYDRETRDMIIPLQELNAIDVRPPGLVDRQTWRMLRDRGCLQYEF
jgi:hypothetical protein